jgi:hypothetical protein
MMIPMQLAHLIALVAFVTLVAFVAVVEGLLVKAFVALVALITLVALVALVAILAQQEACGRTAPRGESSGGRLRRKCGAGHHDADSDGCVNPENISQQSCYATKIKWSTLSL